MREPFRGDVDVLWSSRSKTTFEASAARLRGSHMRDTLAFVMFEGFKGSLNF